MPSSISYCGATLLHSRKTASPARRRAHEHLGEEQRTISVISSRFVVASTASSTSHSAVRHGRAARPRGGAAAAARRRRRRRPSAGFAWDGGAAPPRPPSRAAAAAPASLVAAAGLLDGRFGARTRRRLLAGAAPRAVCRRRQPARARARRDRRGSAVVRQRRGLRLLRGRRHRRLGVHHLLVAVVDRRARAAQPLSLRLGLGLRGRRAVEAAFKTFVHRRRDRLRRLGGRHVLGRLRLAAAEEVANVRHCEGTAFTLSEWDEAKEEWCSTRRRNPRFES